MEKHVTGKSQESNTVASSKVIRIDGEVWSELQERAIPFQDNPNSVLRRVLGLGSNAVITVDTSAGIGLDPRVVQLLELVEVPVGQAVVVSATKNGRSLQVRSKRGKLVAFIHQQIHRIKVESSEQMATGAGVDSWDHRLIRGWWGEDFSVYWHAANDDDDSYIRAANILEKLWRL